MLKERKQRARNERRSHSHQGKVNETSGGKGGKKVSILVTSVISLGS